MHADTLPKITKPRVEANTIKGTVTSTEQQNIFDDRENPKENPSEKTSVTSDFRSDSRSSNVSSQAHIASSIPVQHLPPERVLSPPQLTCSMPLPAHAPEIAYQPLPSSYQYQPYQNVIEMNNNPYGTVTRISNYSSTTTVPTNLAMSIQSPMMSSGYFPPNRFSMIAPHPPQQFEINVYNTLPHSKSFGNVNEYFPLPPLTTSNPQLVPNHSLSNLPPVFSSTSSFQRESVVSVASSQPTSSSTLPPPISTSTTTIVQPIVSPPKVPSPPLLDLPLSSTSTISSLDLPPPLIDFKDDLETMKVPPPPPEFGDISNLLAPELPPPLPKTPPPPLDEIGNNFSTNETFSYEILNPNEASAFSLTEKNEESIGGAVEKLSKLLNESQLIGETHGAIPKHKYASNRNTKPISDWMLPQSDSGRQYEPFPSFQFSSSLSSSESHTQSQPPTVRFQDIDIDTNSLKPEALYQLVSPKPFGENKPVYQKMVKEMTVTETSSTLIENESHSKQIVGGGGITSSSIKTVDIRPPKEIHPKLVTKEMSSAFSIEKQFQGGIISTMSHTEQLSPTRPKVKRPQVPPPPVPYKKVPPPIPSKKPILRPSRSEENILDSDSTKEVGFNKSRPVSLVFSTKQNLGFGKETIGRYGFLEKVIYAF